MRATSRERETAIRQGVRPENFIDLDEDITGSEGGDYRTGEGTEYEAYTWRRSSMRMRRTWGHCIRTRSTFS